MIESDSKVESDGKTELDSGIEYEQTMIEDTNKIVVWYRLK